MAKTGTNESFRGQFEDEEVLLVFRRHPIVMRKGLIIMMVTILVGALFGMFMSRNSATMGEFFSQFFLPVLVGFAVGVIAIFYYWIGWHYSMCIVTNQRFLQFNQKGIFKSRSVNDIKLERIISINFQVRGIVESLFGFGTIIIQTMVGDFVIQKVPKPAETQARIMSAIKESGVHLREEPENTR